MVYYGCRYYHSQIGAWLDRDPVGENGGLNLYGFIDNSPTDKIDPDGHASLDVRGVGKEHIGNCGDYTRRIEWVLQGRQPSGGLIVQTMNVTVEVSSCKDSENKKAHPDVIKFQEA